MGKVKIAGGSYAPRCDLSELRVHYRRGEARLTAGRSAQLIRENRQRRASPAGPRNAALSVLPLACISAVVGINDLISFLQPMIFFFFLARSCWQAWSRCIAKAHRSVIAPPRAGF